MRKPTDSDGKRAGAMRKRSRIRGAFRGKSGKTIGIASLAAPIVGLIANDLRNPDGLIRSVIAPTANRLIRGKMEKREAIDITDDVKIIEDK